MASTKLSSERENELSLTASFYLVYKHGCVPTIKNNYINGFMELDNVLKAVKLLIAELLYVNGCDVTKLERKERSANNIRKATDGDASVIYIFIRVCV